MRKRDNGRGNTALYVDGKMILKSYGKQKFSATVRTILERW
jgi:hypothetical protein